MTVTIGPAQSVEVHAQANILPIISTSVEGGTLHIDATKEFSTTEAVEVVIVTRRLMASHWAGARRVGSPASTPIAWTSA